jgi:hypothetical protein
MVCRGIVFPYIGSVKVGQKVKCDRKYYAKVREKSVKNI